jgi:hypothetical protein
MGTNHSQRGYLAAIYWHNVATSITVCLKADNPMPMWHFTSHLHFNLGVLSFPLRVEVERVAMTVEC